ncbi:hypothetical protein CCACVL1_14864 [Corchorus capsularis]|uniref:Uncharacterized protein n=1 Tax=Corchorus capsularis TaxID=210143 RepID=A0A1R3I559_COCAP|nr:hypothetical protein CCACVL1_14864 [Corchorus capsularis]
MGRRPLAQKRQRNAPTGSKPEVTEPSGGVEKNAESSTPSSEQAKLQSDVTNVQLEPTEPKTKAQRKGKKLVAVGRVRRSERLKFAVTPSQDKDVECIIEEITVSDSEEDEERELPEPSQMPNSLEEKVEYLLQRLEEQQKAIEDLKLKVTMESSPTGRPCAADIRYKNLYFESQKKIEALTEKHQLALKLEHALGKAEAYEKGAGLFAEGLEKLKDVILVTNLTRATEAAMKFSSEAFTSTDAGGEEKRKRAGTTRK